MKKIYSLEQRGKLLHFAEFVQQKLNESIAVDVSANGITVQFDNDSVELIWAEIKGQSNGGDVESLKRYISETNGVDISYIGEHQVISHIMDLVDNRLNNEVAVSGDFQRILGFEEFAEKAKKMDYLYVVGTLVSRLYGYEEEGRQGSQFAPIIADLVANHTNIEQEANNNDAEDMPF